MSEVRLIDANALKDAHIECPNNISFFDFGEMVERFLQTIDEQPTVDAVQVVRCKDCKHRCGTIYARDRITILKVCELRHGTNEQDFYCKDGEREPANGYGVMAARMLE